jgi:hypothetical protein
MASKILGAALLIVLGGLGGYVLASNPHIMNLFHWQRPIERPVQTDAGFEKLTDLDPETKYRLKERCADRAKTFYEEEYASLGETLNHAGSGGTYIVLYESHFNERLNGCLIFEQLKFLGKDAKQARIITMEVRDVNTRQMYALYTGSMCDVHGTTCTSELEWWLLVKPYIEELASP